jgi:predicted amidophosphoribosyltransferase
MKTFCGFVGWIVGMFVGLMFANSIPLLGFVCILGGIPLGRYIGGLIEESKAQERTAAERQYRERIAREREESRKTERRNQAITLCVKYPEAAKSYFKTHWGINKSYITHFDITDDKVDLLLSHSLYDYQKQEELLNPAYRQKIEAEKAAERRRIEEKEKAERRELERKRQELERKRIEEELARKKKEDEKRNLATSLPACVSSWISHSNSSLKHKYFYDYYTYAVYKDNASASMWDTWRTVWHFKNDPSKNVSSYEHQNALRTVTYIVENELRSTFGSKTEYLTLVCLTASSQRKTELRFKDFADKVCKDLNMTNAFPYIKVVEDGDAKHDGGSGSRTVSHDSNFFNGKYVILFDDVRTTGNSIEQERQILERLGAKVICAITIAQTAH